MNMEISGKPVLVSYIFPDLIQRLCQRLVFGGSETLAAPVRLTVISGEDYLWSNDD